MVKVVLTMGGSVCTRSRAPHMSLSEGSKQTQVSSTGLRDTQRKRESLADKGSSRQGFSK